jgi:hypothetical protein
MSFKLTLDAIESSTKVDAENKSTALLSSIDLCLLRYGAGIIAPHRRLGGVITFVPAIVRGCLIPFYFFHY